MGRAWAMAAAIGAGAGGNGSAEAKKYNFVFFLIDDLGWADVGCNNPDTFYETPNIDRLAREGMRFTDGYAACPVCSPTRASIMTGKYPVRVGITDWIPGENRSAKLRAVPNADRLELREETIAEALRAAGYRTGFVGKWHLGAEGFYPEQQGFESNAGGCNWGSPQKGYFAPWGMPTLSESSKGTHLDDRLTEEAEKWLAEHQGQPFYLQFCHYTVHRPIQAKPELVEKYRAKLAARPGQEEVKLTAEHDVFNRETQNDPVYAAMVENMDASIGRVLRKIKELGLEERTVVIFMSDNGGLSTVKNAPTSNRPFRAGKGWLYEGGIREPLIIKWPGVTRPGSVCRHPVVSTDFYPTLLTMAGLPLKPEQHRDGVSLAPLLEGKKQELAPRPIFWHYPHYHGSGHRPAGAVRFGDFKLIEFFEDMRVELFHLKDDIAEKNDLSARMPEKTAELRRLLHDWRSRTGARMPAGPE